MINCFHSGHVGDIVASLCWVQAKCLEENTKASFTIEYAHACNHPNHPLQGIQLSKEWAEQLVPLLSVQPYIDSVHLVKCGERGDCMRPMSNSYNLNLFRHLPTNFLAGDVRRWYFQANPIPFEAERSWITVEPDVSFSGSVVVNRTGRNHNPAFSYHFLQNCGRRVVFAGMSEEYEAFRRQVPLASHYLASDFLGLARCVRGALAFVGVSSACWWLSEAQSVPRALEVGWCPVCVVMTRNGMDAQRQEDMEAIVGRLTT